MRSRGRSSKSISTICCQVPSRELRRRRSAPPRRARPRSRAGGRGVGVVVEAVVLVVAPGRDQPLEHRAQVVDPARLELHRRDRRRRAAHEDQRLPLAQPASLDDPLHLGGDVDRRRCRPRCRNASDSSRSWIRHRSSGKMPRMARRAPLRGARRGAGRGQRGRGDPRRDRGADARADRAQRARAGGDGQLPVHDHRRPRRRVPGGRRARPRPRLGAAALLPRDPGAGLDAAGDPGDGPLLRARRTTRPPTPTSARRRSCAPTSTRPSSGRVGDNRADDRHLRREARPDAGLPGRRADRAGARGDRRRRDRPARLQRVAVPAAPEGGRGDRARRRRR